MTFYNYFNKEKELIEKNKLVIILGLGFHKEAYSINRVKKDKPVLACWQSLLKRLGSKCKLHSPIINFEELIKDETNKQRKKKANAIEKNILKRAGEIILYEQAIASKIRRYAELSKIFNSNYVSDVISLNFDFLPEYLLNRKVSFKKKAILNLNTFYHSTNGIRFWYPQGIAAKSDTIMLSLRNYYTGLQNIESMRSEYKQNELNSLKDRSSITWFSQFMGKPVLILGADISVHETDIWFSLINRSRNFAKKQNEQYKKPIFKMRDETEKDYKGTDIDYLTYKLTNKKMSFNDQWDMLIDLMGK